MIGDVTRRPAPRRPRLSELARATIVIAAICIVVAVGIVLALVELDLKIDKQAEITFQLDARQQFNAVQTELVAAASAAETAGRFSTIAVGIDPIGFSGFLGGITARYPWISAIEWAPRVTAHHLASFTRAAREVLPGYRVRDGGPLDKTRGAGGHEIYYPVALVEPLSMASRVVGVDLGAKPAIRAVFDSATDSAELRASGLLSGMKEVSGDAVVLVWPVYNDMPVRGATALEWRRESLRGFALAVIDIRRVLTSVAAGFPAQSLAITVSDKPSTYDPGQIGEGVYSTEEAFTIGGRSLWFKATAPRALYLPSLAVMGSGVAAACLMLLVIVIAGISARSVVKRSVLIRRLNVDIVAAAAFSRDILDTLREPVVIVDGAACLVAVNRAWSEWRRNAQTGIEDVQHYLDAIAHGDQHITDSHEITLKVALDSVLEGVDDERECDIRLAASLECEQWFTVRIRAFTHLGRRHALIAHVDISRLKRAEQELRQLAITDGLTQIANRRQFEDRLHEEADRCLRYGRPLVLLMLDVDHFKRVNDTYGHPAGDAVLKRIAQVCRESTRGLDLAARFGGEEFVMLLPETDLPGAHQVAERVREEVEREPVVYGKETIRVTVSVGLAALKSGDGAVDRLVREADAAMYAAKQGGRNRVVCA